MKKTLMLLSLIFLISCGSDSNDSDVIDNDADSDGVIDTADCAPKNKDESVELAYLAVDSDGDGYIVKQSGKLCTSGKLPDRYFASVPFTVSATDSFDCDDSNALIWKNVSAYRDNDGDSFGAGALKQHCVGDTLPAHISYDNSDCNDRDRHRWRLTSYNSIDRDLDGIKRSARGSLCTNGLLPAGYSSSPLAGEADCDDTNKDIWKLASVYTDNDGDSFGSGGLVQQCIGESLPSKYSYRSSDCDDSDSTRWVTTQYNAIDSDLDGFKVAAHGTFCTNGSLPKGFSGRITGEADCDDANKDIWKLASVYADSDGDGVGAGESVQRCVGETPPLNLSFEKSDCDDTDKSRWKILSYNSFDGDLDGYRIAKKGAICTNGTLPPEYSTFSVYREPDCDDLSADVWKPVIRYYDNDSDGIGSGDPIQQCIGSNNTLPADLSNQGYDCDDHDADTWRKVVVYKDIDGDLVGSGPGKVSCIGKTPSDGYSILGYDPVDSLSNPESSNITDFDLPPSIITVIASEEDPDNT